MQKFQINRVDPGSYRKEIITLWKNNLPDTPYNRLEWMADNPEGPAVWYLAFHGESKQVAGSISVMPRKVKISGKTYVAGIVGDFAIEKAYRVFGPALQLMNTVVNDYSRLGLAFLYTFPNQASEAIALRGGFKRIGFTSRFVKPFRTKNKLAKYVHPVLANIISQGLDFALKLFSRETYMRTNMLSDQIRELNSGYDSFRGEIENTYRVLGERSREYLKWRYFENPLYRFNMYTFRQTSSGSMLGYVIFTSLHNTIHIFDIVCSQEEVFKRMLGQFLRDARRDGYDSVSIRMLNDNPLCSCIKLFGFMDRKENVALQVFGDCNFSSKEWVFFDGDRNI
jgi:hypothetical protein